MPELDNMFDIANDLMDDSENKKEKDNDDLNILNSKEKNRIIILSAIDNLIKGGSGQAVQNLNNKFNFPEITGLKWEVS